MLTPGDLETITADMDGLALDVEQPFTYYRYAGLNPGDRAAGKAETPDYVPPMGLALTGLVYPFEVTIEGRPGGKVATGEVVFRIRQTLTNGNVTLPVTFAASSGKPVPDDRIMWQDSLYAPIHIDEVRLGIGFFWTVRCQKL